MNETEGMETAILDVLRASGSPQGMPAGEIAENLSWHAWAEIDAGLQSLLASGRVVQRDGQYVASRQAQPDDRGAGVPAYERPATPRRRPETVEIWSNRVVILVTILLSVPSGLVLTGMNLRRLGHGGTGYFLGALGFGFFSVLAGVLLPDIPGIVYWVVGIVGAGLLWFSNSVGEDTAKNVTVVHAPWLAGVGVGILVLVAQFVVGIVVGLIVIRSQG